MKRIVHLVAVETIHDPTDYSDAQLENMCRIAMVLTESMPKRGGKLIITAAPHAC